MAHRKGMIRPGMLADMAVLDRPFDGTESQEILKTRSRLTIVGGRVAWRDGEI